MKPRLSLKGRALQLLAQREQSRVELRRKLAAHAAADGEGDDGATIASRVDELLDWLVANQFASDERFAEARVSARSARFGNLRIRGELAQHGVAASAELAQQLKDGELERALQVWRRKFGEVQAPPPGDAAVKARQARFLAGRGFSPEVIRQALRRGAKGPA